MGRLVNPFRFGGGSGGGGGGGGEGGGGTGADYRFYRFTFYGTLGDLTAVAEIELAATTGGANIATGRSYAASDGWVSPASAFDGNAGSFWYDSAIVAVDAYLQIDFGAPTHLEEVRLKARNDPWYFQAPAAFSLAGSNDGTNWTGIAIYSGYPSWTAYGEIKSFAVPGTSLIDSRTKAIMWRIKSTATQGGGGPGIAEFALATTAGGATICTGGAPIFTSVFGGPGLLYGPAQMLDGNASTFYIAANNTGGARGQMGYVFASPVAPAECRITARNDAYFGDSPKDLAMQWCSDGIHWHTTDSVAGLSWTTGETRAISVNP